MSSEAVADAVRSNDGLSAECVELGVHGPRPFAVVAGKLEWEENSMLLDILYIVNFQTLDEALRAWEAVQGFPHAVIEYRGYQFNIRKLGDCQADNVKYPAAQPLSS